MKKNYKYNDIVRQVDTLSKSPFKNLVNTIGLTIQKIAKMEDICMYNETEVNKKFRQSIGLDPDSDYTDDTNLPTDLSNEVFGDIIPYNNIKNDMSNNEIELFNKENLGEIENKLMNRLYKIIALHCHPDKTSDEIKNKIFIYATESKKSMDLIQSIYLISKTDIGDLDLNENEIHFINSKILELDEYIGHLSNSIFYKWDQLNDIQKSAVIDKLRQLNNL